MERFVRIIYYCTYLCKCQFSLFKLSCFLLATSRLETWVQLPISRWWAIHFRLMIVPFLTAPPSAPSVYRLFWPGASPPCSTSSGYPAHLLPGPEAWADACQNFRPSQIV